MYTSDEEILFYDDETGEKRVNRKKSYTLSKVPERIGCKVNTKSRYYDVDAI